MSVPATTRVGLTTVSVSTLRAPTAANAPRATAGTTQENAQVRTHHALQETTFW